MAKIDLKSNNMAMYMICEAIGPERDKWNLEDLKPDENGLCDLVITFNGKELNVERFIESLDRSYTEACKKYAAELLSSQYEEILKSIYNIQEALKYHNKLFDEKVYTKNEKEEMPYEYK